VVHAVGVRLEADDRLDIAAPFGLDDLFAMIVRPNRVLENAASHTRKARRAQTVWPEVIVIPWDFPRWWLNEERQLNPGQNGLSVSTSSEE